MQTPGDSRLIVLQAYLTPYRSAFFNEIAQRLQLTVVTYGAPEPRRRGMSAMETSFEVTDASFIHLHLGFEKNLNLPLRIGRTLRSLEPSAIVGSFDLAGMIGSRVASRMSIPFLLWSEETATCFAGRGLRPLRRKLRIDQLRRVSGAVAPGLRAEEYLKGLGWSRPVVRVPNAIEDEGVFAEIGRERVDSPKVDSSDHPYRVLFAGSLTRRKGLDVLLEGWKSVLERSELPVSLDVAGHGPLVREEERGNITFHGYVTGRRYQELFESADLFVLPSRCDPNPLVVVQALWSGLPLVLADGVGNGPEAVGRNGYIVPRGDAEAVAEAILATHRWNSKEATSARKESYARASNFSMKRATQAFATAVDRSLGK